MKKENQKNKEVGKKEIKKNTKPISNHRKKILYRIEDVISSSILCLRFPFLYTRNRFSGLHYTNWKILDKIWNLEEKYYIRIFAKEEGIPADTYTGKKYYYKSIKPETLDFCTEIIEYWKHPLMKHVVKLLKFYHNKFLQWLHFIPTHTELDSMPRGWRKRFGIQMCKEIKEALKKDGIPLRKYRIMQIKEKYGTLRWYDAGATERVERVIAKYEYISQFVCVSCGDDATKVTTGWISPYCNKCVEGLYWLYINPIYGYTSNKKTEYNNKKIEEIENQFKEKKDALRTK